MTNSDHATAADDDRVHEWEAGLPSPTDLTPLYQALVPKELAFALSVSPEPHRTLLDVNRASKDTFSGLRVSNFKSSDEINSPDGSGSDSRKSRKVGCVEEADSDLRTEDSTGDPSAKRPRPRLVWTPQLHKRFVDVAAHLGIEKAVPKTIMELMNVEGLTRENVASHLQKYRLYLKRMDDGTASSDLFASSPVPRSFQESGGNGGFPVPVPMSYGREMVPVHGHGRTGISAGAGAYHGFDSHPFNMMHQRDWSGSYNMTSYQHVHPNDK